MRRLSAALRDVSMGADREESGEGTHGLAINQSYIGLNNNGTSLGPVFVSPVVETTTMTGFLDGFNCFSASIMFDAAVSQSLIS